MRAVLSEWVGEGQRFSRKRDTHARQGDIGNAHSRIQNSTLGRGNINECQNPLTLAIDSSDLKEELKQVYNNKMKLNGLRIGL